MKKFEVSYVKGSKIRKAVVFQISAAKAILTGAKILGVKPTKVSAKQASFARL